MSHHRIIGSEADQHRPLAYVSMFRPSRRRHRGYLTAVLIGGALVIAAAVMVLITGASVGTHIH